MARKVHGGRELLNLPGHHSTAVIIAEIEDSKPWGDGGRKGEITNSYEITPEITLYITDCDNKISLECDLDSENSYENSLYKIDTMISSLKAFRRGLVTERSRYIERKPRVPERPLF